MVAARWDNAALSLDLLPETARVGSIAGKGHMRNLIYIVVSGLLLAFCGGCRTRHQPSETHTWEDDAGNYARAFGEQPAKDVKVVHSMVTGYVDYSQALPIEFQFEIVAPTEWVEKVIVQRLRKVGEIGASQYRSGQAEWYAPKKGDAYIFYYYLDYTSDDKRLTALVDKELLPDGGQRIFLSNKLRSVPEDQRFQNMMNKLMREKSQSY